MREEGTDALDRALRALAAETDADAAPAVEERLRAAFRALPESPGAPTAEPGPAPWVFLASLAAAAGVAWLALAGRTQPAKPAVPPPPSVAQAAPHAVVETLPSVAPPRRTVPAAVSRPARRTTAPRREDARPFEALSPGDPLADLDAVHMVRVSVPRRALFALGLRQRPEGQDDAVELDALVGPDGVARAVRLVSAR